MTSPTRFFFKKHCHLKFTSASLPRVTLTPSFLPHLKLESCLVSTWRGQTTPLCIAGAKNKPNGKREAPFGSCGTARQRMCTLIPTAAIIKPPPESWLYIKLINDLPALKKYTGLQSHFLPRHRRSASIERGFNTEPQKFFTWPSICL